MGEPALAFGWVALPDLADVVDVDPDFSSIGIDDLYRGNDVRNRDGSDRILDLLDGALHVHAVVVAEGDHGVDLAVVQRSYGAAEIASTRSPTRSSGMLVARSP